MNMPNLSSNSLSPAGAALNLNAPLGTTAATESDEARKKRMAALQASMGKISATLSPAGMALLGGAQ
jgi:hypothetical protein